MNQEQKPSTNGLLVQVDRLEKVYKRGPQEVQVLADCNEQLSKCKHLFVEYHDYTNSPQQLGSLISLLEENNLRYYIEGVHHRKSPLKRRQKQGAMDLQLNIYAANQKIF